MAKIYDWTGRSGLRNDDEGLGGATLRTRRPASFTIWDWVNWWANHGGDDEFSRAARQQPSEYGRCEVIVSLQRAPDFLGPYLRPSGRAGLGDLEGI